MLGSLPALPLLFLAFSTSSKVTPGFRRNRMAVASLTPVAVVTTLTPPDWVLPPTVIEVLVSVRVSVGTVDACAPPAASRPRARKGHTHAMPARAIVRCGMRRLQRYDIGLILSLAGAEQACLDRFDPAGETDPLSVREYRSSCVALTSSTQLVARPASEP